MKKIQRLLCLAIFISSCNNSTNNSSEPDKITKELNFKESYDFLKSYHSNIVLLEDSSSNAKAIILPNYQGRVMTTTAEGNNGESYGWINYDLIASKELMPHINAYGGEERFWLGPEGGQFSLFFKKGKAFIFENWNVPKELDTESFPIVSKSSKDVSFEKNMHLVNYTGTEFDIKVNRKVKLLNKVTIEELFGKINDSIQIVGIETNNTISNIGKSNWTKESGLLSIWLLSMLNATEKTTVIAPYKMGDSAQLGKIVTDDYFGKVPAERLKVQNGLMYFKADAAYRSKIGISPQRALPWIASYDADKNLLTVAQFSLPANEFNYVNSTWKIQEQPFAGDAVNAYNDGPINNKQIGRFYEIESSSPAIALKSGESITHTQKIIHFKGSKQHIETFALKTLNIHLQDISNN